jgi:hypothetical protein
LIGGVNGITKLYTEAGNDNLLLGVQTFPPVNRIRQLCTLDGGTGSDFYNLSWSGVGSSTISVEDSSELGADFDAMNVFVSESSFYNVFLPVRYSKCDS